MNNFSLKAGLGLAFLGAMFATGANAVSVSNNAAVTIVTPLIVTPANDMNFGKVVKPASGSQTVILSTAGVRSGTATLASGITSAAGTVSITGAATETVSITVADTTAVTGLTLSDFTSDAFGGQTLSGGTLTGATLTGSAQTLTLGATLNVSSAVTTGLKTPTYTVDVNYN